MTTRDYAQRARLAAGMLIDRINEMDDEGAPEHEIAIRRAYHQLAATLGELHGATTNDAKEIVEELMLSDG